METLYLKVDSLDPDRDIIQRAADIIKAGELVAFPTETVYGLGFAAAFEPEAVDKIFAAKGRPENKPLLVHVSSLSQVESLAGEISDKALLLMEKFWPGPLSIIVPAGISVPGQVRGGRSTVGLRMPDHPVALALIEAAGPIAAPSANISGRRSPVTAEQVLADLDGKIAAVLDSGLTGLGIESTVLDISTDKVCILRKGGVAAESIEAVLAQNIIYS